MEKPNSSWTIGVKQCKSSGESLSRFVRRQAHAVIIGPHERAAGWMTKTQVSKQTQDIGMQIGVPFVKMHGLGNDFVFINEMELKASEGGRQVLGDLSNVGGRLAAQLCHRNFGIGADGLVVVRPAQRPDCQIGWKYFNSDGSEASMCGNALRCLALYGRLFGFVETDNFSVDTAVGAVPVVFKNAATITTDLGRPFLKRSEIPIARSQQGEDVTSEFIEVANRPLKVTCVGMGNPHAVIFDANLGNDLERQLAPEIQRHPLFPKGVNVEFVSVKSATCAFVFVWERGCGPTLACASGAAAVLVAGVLEGRLERQAEIVLPGGTLSASWAESDGHVRITGPASVAYSGTFDLAEYLPEVSD